MKKEKIIGIPGYSLGDNSFGAGKHHLNYISKFGIPRILMPQETEVQNIDLLYLPGGLDLNPANYGEIPGFFTSNNDVFKEYFYRTMLDKYIQAEIPIAGVCLGMQMLNCKFNGTLTQDLPEHSQSLGRGKGAHRVLRVLDYDKESLKLKLLSKKTTEGLETEGFYVNSHHHQGVKIENLSDSFIPLYASEDKVIEIISHKSLPIIGIQAHPEEYNIPFFNALIREFLQVNKVENNIPLCSIN